MTYPWAWLVENLPPDLVEEMRHMADSTGCPPSVLVEQAFRLMLGKPAPGASTVEVLADIAGVTASWSDACREMARREIASKVFLTVMAEDLMGIAKAASAEVLHPGVPGRPRFSAMRLYPVLTGRLRALADLLHYVKDDAAKAEALRRAILAAADLASAQDANVIRTLRALSNAALEARDVESVVAHLDPEAHLTISDGRFVNGREAQRSAYAAQFARFPDVVYRRQPETIEVSRSQPLAAERGVWIGQWTTDTGPVEMRGHYMAMWRKTAEEGGMAWRIRSELFVVLECGGSGCPPRLE